MTAKYFKRRGFTLVELLVVIVIIGILAALITVAVSGAVTRAKEARIQMELGQLAGAIQLYKKEYGSYPPSTHNLLMNPPRTMLVQHIRSLFPRVIDADLATLPPVMNAAEILAFCVRGYTNDPQRPVNYLNNNVQRDNFMDFDAGRLRPGRPFQVNIPGQGTVTGQTTVYVQSEKDAPYVYFDCSRPLKAYQLPNGQDNRAFPAPWESTVPSQNRYAGPTGAGTVKPYWTMVSGSAQPVPANSPNFQIIAAGVDGDFGDFADPTTVKRFPDGLNYAEGDKDNLVNFSERNLENSKP